MPTIGNVGRRPGMTEKPKRFPMRLTSFISLQQQIQTLAVEAKKAGQLELASHCFVVSDLMDDWKRRVLEAA